MKIFLLWRNGPGQHQDAARVASDLWSLYAPLFKKLPAPTIRQTSAATLVFLELPVPGWKPRFFEEYRDSWALAPDYPVDARAVLDAKGASIRGDDVLLALGRELRKDPFPLLKEMAPHFSLIWSPHGNDDVFVQNDGLGQAQVFQYQNGGKWALTNRIFAFKALGLPLEPVPENWAVRWTLNWFPMNLTGYKSVHLLDPGTQIRVRPRDIKCIRHDVLPEWIGPKDLSCQDCIELARWSLLKKIDAVLPQIDRPILCLSGGRDSRAIGSALRASGLEFSMKVEGQAWRPDVIIATELAKIADLEIERDDSLRWPPDNAADCRRGITNALLWLAGDETSHKSKLFLADGARLEEGSVTMEGHAAGIFGGYFQRKVNSNAMDKKSIDGRLVEYFVTRKMPPFMRNDLRARIREIIHEACRQSDSLGLLGPDRISYFHLMERDRRYINSHLYRRTGLVFSPLLIPGYIRAAFAYSGDDKITKPFHRYIIATDAPDWANVPYDPELKKDLKNKFGPGYNNNTRNDISWRRPKGRFDYDNHIYYQDVAKPLIDECLDRGGFWTEIFDPDLTREQWAAAPDKLAITYLLPELL